MRAVNLALRFLLELAGLAALAYWGWQAADSLPLRLVYAVLAPLALAVVWALVVAPGADNPIPQQTRMLIGTLLLLVAAGALAAAGVPALAGALAVLVVVNQALLMIKRTEDV